MFQRSSADFAGLPRALRPADVLILREPWAEQPPPAACGAASNALVRPGPRHTAPSVRSDGCLLTGWSAQTYQAALAVVLAKEQRGLAGIVGQSFGALPAAAARAVAPDAWLVLNAPIAPGDQPGRSVLADRITSLETALAGSYQRACSTIGADCGLSAVSVLSSAVGRTPEVVVPGRSQALTAFDFNMAVVAAAYDLAGNEDWLWRTLHRLPDIGEADYVQIGRLADQILQRSGSGEVSVRLLAYAHGLCASYRGWDLEEKQARPGGVGDWFLRLGALCSASSPGHGAWAPPEPSKGRVCILANDGDSVTSASWGMAWKRLFPHAHVAHYRFAGHTGLDRALNLGTEVNTCLLQTVS